MSRNVGRHYCYTTLCIRFSHFLYHHFIETQLKKKKKKLIGYYQNQCYITAECDGITFYTRRPKIVGILKHTKMVRLTTAVAASNIVSEHLWNVGIEFILRKSKRIQRKYFRRRRLNGCVRVNFAGAVEISSTDVFSVDTTFSASRTRCSKAFSVEITFAFK